MKHAGRLKPVIVLLILIMSSLLVVADGTYVSQFNLNADNDNPSGVGTDGNYIWVTDLHDDRVYKYTMSGTYTDVYWDTAASGCGSPMGLGTDGVNIYILDHVDYEVYKYTMDGVYTGTHWDTEAAGGTNVWGLGTDGTNIYISDDYDDLIYKYDMDGNYISSFDIRASGCDQSYGVGTDGNYIWISELYGNDEVYKYTMDGTYVSRFNVTDWCFGVGTDGISIWVVNGEDNIVFKYEGSLAILPNEPIDIEETTVTLKGLVRNVGDSDIECGFWYNTTTPVNESNSINVSSGFYGSNDVFTKSISGLTSGEYYYYKAWCIKDGFYNSTNEATFLTKPYSPTNFQITDTNANNITLSWTNATVAVTNHTTMIRYSDTGYPTLTTGTLGYNGTGEACTIESLSVDTTYYFKAWTYINASGSPFYYQYSDDADSTSGHTEGGAYNITIRYEGNLSLVDPTSSKFLNSRCWAETMEGFQLAYNDTFTTNPFTINTTQSIDIFRFDYNNQSLIRCVTPSIGQRNITIYVCDKALYNATNDLNDSQLFYTFSFVNDFTPNSIFLVSPESKLYIYLYNGSTKYYIDQSFFSAEDTVRVPLEYNKRYWIGLECDALYIPFLQYIDTSAYQYIDVNILYKINATYIITDFTQMNLSWGGGMYVNYTDFSENTNSANISIYKFYPVNGTKVLENTYTFSTSSTNYHYTTGMGCGDYTYYVTIEVDHNLIEGNETLNGILLYPIMGNGTSIGWLEGALEGVLGESPLPSVRWIDLFGLMISFMVLVSFGQLNGNLSLIASGLVILFLEVGLAAFTAAASTLAVSVGVSMMLFGIVFMYGSNK